MSGIDAIMEMIRGQAVSEEVRVTQHAQPRLIIITAYLPLPPKWITPGMRRPTP